jgi:predicted DCC family thiol-disulfide oxidoreductase YuxK
LKVLNTTDMKSLTSKLIIYDSNCKVCSSLRDVVLRLTSIPKVKIKAYKDLTPELSAHVDPEKFKNVMALIDTSGGKTIYGTEGVAYIFSSQYKVVDFLFRLKPIFKLFNFFYKTSAYNRYIIATPKSNFKCDCFPDRVVKYRISYIVMALLISIFLTAMFGISLRNFFSGMSGLEASKQMLLMAGTGWVLQILLAITILKDKALDYIGHLGSIMVVGLLILTPWILFHAVSGILNPYLPVLSVLISSACMLYLHINRLKYLELSQAWTISWFLLLQSTALFWVYFFHIK